ncbi:OLC1v1013157C1 [Oldenlandia corymbosa var. corymbosa]|uniref:OLC1v1013157C1 n=1 Tax=Oldenlandia corymbosa var. corymbosa TaxID=529605 RepID=A0AAV1DZM5_OLDCO|nr:OLC1v1013157C1 [Oldenlandia corymbosa var. corymbosa]
MENLSSGIVSPRGLDPLDDDLLPWEGQKSDDEPEDKSSDFSSCGESEFERYCSANSALGTPSSVCNSSVYEFADSEFGSFENFKLGGDRKSLTNFLGDKKLLNFSGTSSSRNSGIEFRDGKRALDGQEYKGHTGVSKKKYLNGLGDAYSNGSEIRLVGDNDLGRGNNGKGAEETGIEAGDGSKQSNYDSKMSVHYFDGTDELADDSFEGLDQLPGLGGFDGSDVERRSDECETSSRDEHSDGDDSGCVSDNGRKYYLNSVINKEDLAGNMLAENDNGLCMSSAIAFGQNDWDDFMQETSRGHLSMMHQHEFLCEKQEMAEDEISNHIAASSALPEFSRIGLKEHDEVLNVSRTSYQIHEIGELEQPLNTPFTNNLCVVKFGEPSQLSEKANQLKGVSESAECSEIEVVQKDHKMDQNHSKEVVSLDEESSMSLTQQRKGYGQKSTYEATGFCDNFGQEQVKEMNFVCDPLSGIVVNDYDSAENSREQEANIFEENDLSSKHSPVLLNHFEDHFSSIKGGNPELNDFFDEMVHEMEEILMDTGKAPGSKFMNSLSAQHRVPLSSRDGGSTASTSGTDEVYPFQLPLRISGVEVIGARQKRGDVSFSERLVGVKEYTVYRIRVWNGEENWEVERRYRDFYTLYRQLKKVFHDQNVVLPPPWSSVERESRKIFGNATPDVIAERSILIQECLQSVIQSKLLSSGSLSSLMHFLSSSKVSISSSSSTPLSQSQHSSKATDIENVSTLGNTISLVVHLRPRKSMKQLLDEQHYTCAGCHKNFDEGNTRMKELALTLGWGKPRYCEYSGQLFCSSCHNNDTAVLPSRVLHQWDFTQYTVSQLSKSYLDSIFDKPMLCVSAVNPHLFSRVPALQYVRNVRKRIGAMLPFIRCPFRRSILKGLGSRRYLLESNEFFALRDLIDLSKGMFAALPVIVETISRKMLEHITEQCLICCDSGTPCNARQACNDPSALIFPFQEEEVERCRSCDSVFHKRCFGKIITCSCGTHLKPNEAVGLTGKIHANGTGRTLNSSRKETYASGGFLSTLFSKAMAQTPMRQKESPKDNNTVILMGSLPSTSI